MAFRKRAALIAIAALCALCAIAGLAVVASLGSKGKRAEDSPDKFFALAEIICPPLPTSIEKAQEKPSDPELIARLKLQDRSLQKIANSSDRLSSIAESQIQAIHSFQSVMEGDASDFSNDYATGALWYLFGENSGNRELTNKGLLKLGETLIESRSAAEQAQKRVVDVVYANRIEIAGLANDFSGPPLDIFPLDVRYSTDTTSWFFIDPDKIAMKNLSSKTLTNCVVSVKLVGVNGATFQNVHFVKSWLPDETRFGVYPKGNIFGDGSQTVSDVNRVSISLWSQTGSPDSITIERPATGWK